MEREVAEAGLDVLALDFLPPDLVPARRPRVAVIEPWGGAIDAGWTRWVLEQHAFEFTRIRPADLQDRAAAARLDAIVIPDVPSLQLLRGLQGSQTRAEHRGGLEDRGVATLKQFVRAGGTVITLGNAAEFAIDHLDLPAVVATRTDDADTALVPGTLLRTTLAPDHPVNAGMPPRRRRDERHEQCLRARAWRRRTARHRGVSGRAAGDQRLRHWRVAASRTPGGI